jgi:hypothetical protein
MKQLNVPQSGSLGATTASRNSSGQYLRARAMPTQPRTASQVNQRARLTAASAGWRGLTQAQIAAWNAFAQSFTVVNSLGTAIHLTGAQCYIKVNTVNALNGDANVVLPPALPAFLANTCTGITAVAATPLISIQGTAPAAGTKFMVFASPQLSPGVSFNGNYRYMQTSQTFTAGAMSIQTAYAAKYGALIVGKKIFVKVVQSQAGMQDNGTLFATIVA